MTNLMLVKTVIIIFCLSIRNVVVDSNGCASPQYIRIGTTGNIKCAFEDDVYGVFWYNTTDPFHDRVIITSEDSIKKGTGFLSGEFDISQDGSLIIKDVSMKHEGTYTVVKLDTPTSQTRTYVVIVSVTANTFSHSPVISNCYNSSGVCFQILDEHSEVSCKVKDSRQAVHLYWMMRTIDGDRNVSSNFSVKSENHPFLTSRVATEDFFFSPLLALLVCKAESPPGLLKKNESVVLIQNENFATAEPHAEYLKINSRLELNCADIQISYLVWQVRKPSDRIFSNVLYAVFVGTNFTYTDDEEYKLKKAGSLVLDSVRIQHEGIYRCVSGNGLEDGVKVYNVTVIVSPVPAYLIVDGCTDQQYCVLEGYTEGSLTCMLQRVHPRVNLDVTELFQESLDAILFYDKILTVKDNGGTFDVLLTSKYRYNGPAKTKLTIECKVIGTEVKQLHLSRIFDMWFVHGAVASTEENSSSNRQHLWVIPLLLSTVLVVLVIGGIAIIMACRQKRRLKNHKSLKSETGSLETRGTKRYKTFTKTPTEHQVLNDNIAELQVQDGKNYPTDHEVRLEETIPMVPQEDPTVAKKELFISELKAKYQDLYSAVQPIPYIRERLFCVDRVFVEGGIEYMVANEKIGGEGKWEKLFTYHNILDDDRVKSKRRIIEGDPGYGKSFLTLQLAYDWCNEINASYLKNIDVLIVLRLRQLGGVTSIYRAIRQFLLPKDSQLKEGDIEQLVRQSNSTLVVLDGYDEYPDEDDHTQCDVINIIARKMFQQFEVILTTRSSCLPNDYPALTKRLKLRGFDNKARDQYIRKAVVGNDTEAVEKIKQRLQENPVFGYVCEVPLLFVMFAHMSHESEQFQKLDSLTKFFSYMISCFYSHMRNKMKDENVRVYDLFETDHRELDKLAFEGLSGKNQKIVWRKKDICERLGKDFYDLYVRMGILVEEEVLDISDTPSPLTSEYIQYTTEVRFYHKIFCEWYAAHHLSNYLSKDDVSRDSSKRSQKCEGFASKNDHFNFGIFLQNQKSIVSKGDHYLESLDPFNVHYVFLFACGLSSGPAAEKIINYLQTKKETSQFEILCLIEQNGNLGNILEEVDYMCKTGFTIKGDDSLMLQTSTMQLLRIAWNHKLPISALKLINCYSAVEECGESILLKSKLSLPLLSTLMAIEIWESGKIITEDELAKIVHYSTMCDTLKDLILSRCLLPQFIKFPEETHSILRSRKVKVYWWPRIRYRLNLESLLWEDTERDMVITNDEYQSEVNWCRDLLES